MHDIPSSDEERALLTRLRRDLHRIPELDCDLPKTLAYIRAELEGVEQDIAARHGADACRIFSPCESSLCMFFDRGSKHATAVRADMDALPVTEKSDVEFASCHKGCMHACGHDGHMSMVLALARHIADSFDELPRSILLVFQPAEETTGGARFICESGVFEECGVDRIFGFHLWPDLEKGAIASRQGGLLAAASESTFTFHGKAAHIAKAADGADALEAGARFLLDAYAYMDERRAEEPCLLKCGVFRSGDVRNVISSHTRIEGSLRTFSEEMGARTKRDLALLARIRAEEAGCTVETHFADGYPPVVNDAALYRLAAETLDGLQELPEPLLIGEDFAFYQRHLPGVFFLLGTGTGIPLHADTFDFDESILAAGLNAYKKLIRIP
ncbi:MAG: amidohydrolase [Slackia sp.]|nr:amidohydrolase [Slackia sp.]